jgi:histidine triad (HIT) family protein
MASIFSKIVRGEIPCHKIAETEDFFAFLDIRPLAAGHTLVIPKEEINYVFDLEDAQLSALMVFAKKVAKAIEAEVPCKRIGLSVIGLEVPHTHVHLVPINQISDMTFGREPVKISDEEMADLAKRIAARVVV